MLTAVGDSYPPDPDFGRLRKVLLRQGEPDRVPIVELFADHEIMEAVIGEQIPRQPATRDGRELALRRVISFWYEVGYDYVSLGPTVRFPWRTNVAEDTAELARGQRQWVDESAGIINSWEDFESYPWPRPEEVDFSGIEFVGRHLPEGMKLILLGDPGGQLENLMFLMGYAPLALALKDDPALVQAVADKSEELLAYIFSTAADMPWVGALWLGDDMGFKTSTMIAPEDLRRYVLPCHRRLAQIAHKHDLPFLLHSCGNLKAIMGDLIDNVQIDAKHSFEDVIEPVTEAKRLYGSRIALLGGIDVDLLCRADEEGVRRRTRELIEACAPGGGWALGTGNSVANYIPVRNYLAMLDEGRRCGAY